MATEAQKIQYAEVAAPSTPGTGKVVTYAKADGLMYSKDDAGTETLMSSGADGSAAHIADTTDAHDASAVSFDATGLDNTTATEVQTALEEFDSAITAAGGASGAMTMISDDLKGSSAASFDFTSIPGSYKHLMMVVEGRSTVAAINENVFMRFNNDSGSNYDYSHWAIGELSTISGAFEEGNGATSFVRVLVVPGASSTAGDAGNMTLWFPNYASTTFNHTFHGQGGTLLSRASGNIRFLQAFGSWRSTAAITRITLSTTSGSWDTGSRATLYGIS